MTPYERAMAAFIARHAEDPKRVVWKGQDIAWSLLYHRHLQGWVDTLDPHAPEAMRLAAACQHIERWTMPREAFPEGVTGYKQWRSTLARFHAEQAEGVLQMAGYDASTRERVRDFLLKKGRAKDPEVQRFEDAICLTFIELQLASFAEEHDEPKLIGIIQKTWAKMSPEGHREALRLADDLPENVKALVVRTVGTSP